MPDPRTSQAVERAAARLTSRVKPNWSKFRSAAYKSMRKGQRELTKDASRATGLKLAQARRRFRLYTRRTRGAYKPGAWAKISTGHDAARVHVGRLRLSVSKRKSRPGVRAGGRFYPKAFLWNPAGRTLVGEKRRVWIPQLGGQKGVGPITHPYRIERTYRKLAHRILRRTAVLAVRAARKGGTKKLL